MQNFAVPLKDISFEITKIIMIFVTKCKALTGTNILIFSGYKILESKNPLPFFVLNLPGLIHIFLRKSLRRMSIIDLSYQYPKLSHLYKCYTIML